MYIYMYVCVCVCMTEDLPICDEKTDQFLQTILPSPT